MNYNASTALDWSIETGVLYSLMERKDKRKKYWVQDLIACGRFNLLLDSVFFIIIKDSNYLPCILYHR